MKNLDLTEALNTAIRASQRGRQVVMDYFGRLKNVQEKAQAGLVSEADVESERAIGEELARGLPGVAILGEEEAFRSHDESVKATTWIVDPLDGTTNYVHRFPIFCISIGLQWQGELVVGVIDAPIMNRVYTCAKGQGAFVNGERIQVSRRATIQESLLATGFVPEHPTVLKEQIKIFSDLVFEARGIRRAGAAAYDLSQVADGVFDLFWEKNLKPWDAAAGALMVREAGGVVWNYKGEDYRVGDDSLLAGNPRIAEAVLKRIQAVT